MKHFSQHDWADYARGVRSSQHTEMKAHLAQCASCKTDLEVWQGVIRMTTHPAPQVPESTVRVVKMAFALHKPRKQKAKQWRAEWAILDLDSWLATLPEA